MRFCRSFCFLLGLVLVFVGRVSAQERRYTLGTTVDLTGGGTNRFGQVNAGSTQSTPPFFYFYGAYPSVSVNSAGPHSALNASYAFGLLRTETAAQNLHTDSHSASVGFSNTLSQQWKISLTERFEMTNDPATFNAFRGIAAAAEDPVFNPIAQQVVMRSNNADFAADYSVTDRSTFSFSGSHALRDYGKTPGRTDGLSNQDQISGSMTYKHRTGAHDTWSVAYTPSYFRFKSFQNAFSHAATVGYSTQIGRSFNLDITTGVSQTQNVVSRESFAGYNASARLEKKIDSNSFALYYRQTSGESTGLGAISDQRRAGLSLKRDSKKATLFLDIASFDTRGRLGNTLTVRGVQGVATIGIPLNRTLSIQGGAQYDEQKGASLYAFTQKRVFISFRYSNPTLLQWSGSR